MKRTYYYSDELNDDFAGTDIKAAALPEDYRYVRFDGAFRAARFLVYKLFATPVIIAGSAVLARVKNGRVLKGYKKGGAFLYGNHTAYVSDAAAPTRIAFPRTADVVVNPDAVSIGCGVGGLVRLLGGVPVPDSLHGLKNFSADIERAAKAGHWIAIYPEAHIWPYYTGIRPFGAASFKYPARCGVPAFAFTATYKKRRFFKRPRRVIYIDGPFFGEGETVKRRAESLRAQVYAAMCARAKLSDCTYCEYRKADGPGLAARLNEARPAGGGADRAALKRDRAEALAAPGPEDGGKPAAVHDGV